MYETTGIGARLSRGLENTLREAAETDQAELVEPLELQIAGVEFNVEPGGIFAVAGLSEHGKARLRRTLEQQPSAGIIFMDDPFSTMDSFERARMQKTLRRLHNDLETTVVLLTDDCEEALAVGDQVVITRGTNMTVED